MMVLAALLLARGSSFRGRALAVRRRPLGASEGAGEAPEAVEDDASLATAFRSAARRTEGARRDLARAERAAAREAKRPKKPRLAMSDRRVRATQEPMNELNELLSAEEGGWSSLDEAELVPRLGALYAAAALFAFVLVDDFDAKDELVEFPLLFRLFLPLALGGLAPLVAAGRVLARWSYVDSRLAEDVLYFEETGWADGFMAKKTEDVINRDQQARTAEVAPRLSWQQRVVSTIAAATASLFVVAAVAP